MGVVFFSLVITCYSDATLRSSSSSSTSRSTRLRTCVSGFTSPCAVVHCYTAYFPVCLIRLPPLRFPLFHCCFHTFVLMHHHGDLPPVDAITYCYNSTSTHQDFAGTPIRGKYGKNILRRAVRRTSGRVGTKWWRKKESIVAAAKAKCRANQEKGDNNREKIISNKANASQDKEESSRKRKV